MIANFLYRNSKTANIKRRYQSGISDFCGTQSGVRATSRLPRRNGRRGSWRAGRPPDLFGWGKQYRGGIFRLLRDAVRGRGGYSNLREKMIVGGAGGPGALQTSPPARSRKLVDTNPLAALAGLTCRASPANSSIAGGAALDSVRLRRNCSLLLCVSQSSSLTCARGAYRAWAREKAGMIWKFLSRRLPRLYP